MTSGPLPSAMRVTACRVCGSTATRRCSSRNLEHSLTPDDLRITDARYGLTLPLAECDECGFRFADTGEVDRLTSLYADVDDPGYAQSQDSRALQMRWLVKLAREAHPAAATALDVGAASGLLVVEAQRQGLNAIGIEPSRWLVALARNEHGVTVLCGVLPHPELEGRKFDTVFLVDVVEHVADPIGLLGLCADHLADDGVLLVVTPDVASMAARMLGKRWWHYRLAHVGYFDRRSLARAFERTALRPLIWKRSRWFFSVRYLATRAESYFPVAGLNRIAERTAPLRWLYERVIPVNLFDSYAVITTRAREKHGVHSGQSNDG